MEVDTEPQEVAETEVQDVQETQEEVTQVPLSALQKERRKRQELEERAYRAEVEAQYLREQVRPSPEPVDNPDDYEPPTRQELKQTGEATKREVLREVEEKIWKKQNPDQWEYVQENLEVFLKQRPNLASAISESVNRYEEAYELMSKLSPREQKALKPSEPKKQAPNAPTSVPKAAGVNQVIDVMSMSDEEFNAWRRSKRQRR